MEIPQGLIEFLILFVNFFGQILSYALILRLIFSWVFAGDPQARYKIGGFVGLVHDVTEPIAAIFRKLPLRIGMIDFSLWIAIVAVDLSRGLIISLLLQVSL